MLLALSYSSLMQLEEQITCQDTLEIILDASIHFRPLFTSFYDLSPPEVARHSATFLARVLSSEHLFLQQVFKSRWFRGGIQPNDHETTTGSQV